MSQTLAFVFPGQGSQQQGMLSDLAADFPIITETFGEASSALGYDLWTVVQSDPDAQLNQTEVTQPALLTASVSLYRLWLQQGGATPSVMAGHSLGEYSALVCADALSLSDAVQLVRTRGQLMQAAVPAGTGAMAAILGLDDPQVVACCAEAAQGAVVSAVNFNCPGQVVIAGEREAVARAINLCKTSGAKRAIELPVSVPSHCALMKPAAEQLGVALEKIDLRVPSISVIHNVTAQTAQTSSEVCELLVDQLFSPVRWTESMQAMIAQGVDQCIECGPGKVLSGLNKKIDRSLGLMNLGDSTGFSNALNQLGG